MGVVVKINRLWESMGHHCNADEFEEDSIGALVFVVFMLYGIEWLILLSGGAGCM